jgi:hypothetical protein
VRTVSLSKATARFATRWKATKDEKIRRVDDRSFREPRRGPLR